MRRWPLVQLRHVTRFGYGAALASDERTEGSVPVFGSNGQIGTHATANTVGTTIVIGRKGSHGRLQFSETPVFAIDTTYFIDRRMTQQHLRWLYYALHTARLQELSQDVGVPGLNREDAYSQRVPLPDPGTQRAIANFLDTETARVDALISRKRRMLVLLSERLGAFVRNRLASIEPKLPLRRRWMVIDCKHRTPDYTPIGYPVVSPGDVTPGRLDLSRSHRFVDEQDLADLADVLRRPKRGDIVYSRNASIGIASFVDTDAQFCMGQDVCLITSSDQDQLFLTYVLNSVGVDQLDMHKIGSTFSRVNVAQILDLLIPCPPPPVQRLLAAEFDFRARLHNETVLTLERQLKLLQEHRHALIMAAVNGELDLPEVAA